MKVVLVTKDKNLVKEAKGAFTGEHTLRSYEDWRKALDYCAGADLMIVDLLATIKEPHKIAGYEDFAVAKMSHPKAKKVPLVVISAPLGYKLDYMAGWPDFVFGMVRPPVTSKIFKRVSTWV